MQPFSDNYLLQYIFKYEDEFPPIPIPLNPHLKEIDDERLLALIKQGNRSTRQDAFAELYRRHYLDIWRLIKSKGYFEADAKDIFGEVWKVTLEKLPDFEWQNIPIKAWLLSTAHYKSLEFNRKVEAEKTVALDEDSLQAQALEFIYLNVQLDDPPSYKAPPQIVQIKADRLLQQALSQLKPKPRKIIYLIYFKKKNSSQISQELKMKPSAVRTAHSRALKKLLDLLSSGGTK